MSVRTIRRILTTAIASTLAALLPAASARADFCVGDGCGAARGPEWHLHCEAQNGQDCWDASDDTCDLAGQCAGSTGVFGGALSTASAEVAAVQVANEIFTQFVVPPTPPAVTQQLAEGGEQREPGASQPATSEVSGVVQYESYEMSNIGASIYGGKVGYEFDSDAVGFGLRVPLQYVTFSDFDLTGFRVGGEAFFKAHLVKGPVIGWNLGLAAVFNGLKFQNNDFGYLYGGGPFTSLDVKLGPVGMTLGGAGTYSKPKEGDGFLTFAAGGSAGIPLGSILAVSGHGYWTALYTEELDEIEFGQFPDTSNSYATLGLEVGVAIVRSWMLTLGYNYRFGFGDYSSNEVYLGSSARF